MITLFSTCKPFEAPKSIRAAAADFDAPGVVEAHHATINALHQRNAIRSWLALTPRPEIILLGNDAGTAAICAEFGLTHIPNIAYTVHGKPDVADLFAKAQAAATTDTLAYVNADICLFDDFLAAVDVLRWRLPRFMMCGQRHNFDVTVSIRDWTQLQHDARTKNDLLVATGTDYFVFKRGMLTDLAQGLGAGHLAWDNYLPWVAVTHDKAALVDATQAVLAIHQNHPEVDFNGHPGAGQNHSLVRQQNPDEPGAYCGLFLKDASHVLTREGLIPKVSIVLPSYKRPERLEAAVRRILEVTPHTPLEVLVVIDEDTDSRDRIDALGDPRVQVLFNAERLGAVACWNQGLKAARGDILAFWNDDCMPEPGWLEAALEAHQAQLAGYGLVGFNDGYQDGNELAVQYLYDRAFCRDHLGGVMAYPVYEFAWNDTEANARAKLVHRFYWCKESIVQHHHWSRQGGQKDALNEENMHMQGRDGYIYYAREQAGFPNDFEAVL